MTRRRPEVLAPVGSPECLSAAVAGGADAVFLGLRHFNARGRAENFRKADLAHHVQYLHHHGLKCYVVMNTLIHDDEYAKALDLASTAQAAGVDAVIIQDLGLWTTLAREMPALKRHASTQMTIHEPGQVAVLAQLGAERVILARELSLAEVGECTRVAAQLGIETEHFVHGALCYAYSGQCLMSNFAGCRSANRGTCAQNCRFDYVQDESDAQTLLSMRDFAAVGQIAGLADAGVASLKIEGRLKGPEYVYTTSRIYRAATEAWLRREPFDLAAARSLLRDVFARPHTEAPLQGDYGENSRLHRWEPDRDRQADATLESLDRRSGSAVLRGRELRAGQGFAYTHGMWNGGFLVISADPLGSDRWRCTVRSAESGPRLPAGLALFRNADHARKREAASAMSQVAVPPAPEPTVDLQVRVTGQVAARLQVTVTSSDGRSASAASAMDCQAATGRPLDQAALRESLGAFGGSGFHCATLELLLDGALFVPAAELKRLRRTLVDQLTAQTPSAHQPTVSWLPPEPGQAVVKHAALWVAVGSLAAARAAFAAGADQVWLDDPTLDLWGPSVPRLDVGERVWLRHPATARTSPHLAALGLPVVAGHLGVVAAARAAGLAVIGDHPLNVFGYATLHALGELGVSAATMSLECSSREVARLAARLGTAALAGERLPGVALTVHGRLPAMLTRQDHGLEAGAARSFRATAADGGLPYEMQRRAGGDTVIWEGRRLCAAESVAITATLVDAWLLELADLTPEAVAELVQAYADLRDGRITAAQIELIAQRHAPHGLFPGHLLHGSRELDLAVEGQA